VRSESAALGQTIDELETSQPGMNQLEEVQHEKGQDETIQPAKNQPEMDELETDQTEKSQPGTNEPARYQLERDQHELSQLGAGRPEMDDLELAGTELYNLELAGIEPHKPGIDQPEKDPSVLIEASKDVVASEPSEHKATARNCVSHGETLRTGDSESGASETNAVERMGLARLRRLRACCFPLDHRHG
jgi:hypothetical protein